MNYFLTQLPTEGYSNGIPHPSNNYKKPTFYYDYDDEI